MTNRPVPVEVADAASLLGVTSSASATEIKLAFRTAVRLLHPDADGPANSSNSANSANSANSSSAADLAVVGRARDTLLRWRRSPESFGRPPAATSPARPTTKPASGSADLTADVTADFTADLPMQEPDEILRSILRFFGGVALLGVFALVGLLIAGSVFTSSDNAEDSKFPPPPVPGWECIVLSVDGRLETADCSTPGAFEVVRSAPGNAACPATLQRVQTAEMTFCLEEAR